MRLLLCVVLLSATLVRAEPVPIGFVKNVAGEASVTTAGQQRKAEVGSPIHVGSVLRTGAQGTLGVTFKDETVMSFGPNTELTVDEYLYEPSRGKLKLNSKLARGSMNYVSGVIAKLQPEAVSVRTPAGLIGVRGTQFLLKVED
ncbi:MAG TPA: FecR domain-containing protein [Azonexus sp.]